VSVQGEDPRQKDGVVLLHGISRTSRSLRKMQAAIEACGLVTLNLDYPSRRKALEPLADDLHAAIEGFAVLTVTSPEPCDVACLTTMFQTAIPQLTLPISFALPPAGSKVRAFGYPNGDHDKLVPDSLQAVEGEVLAHFPPRFDAGFMRGPAFLVSGSVPHGMSGGPVVNESGAACGLVSAGAENLVGRPAFLVSPLYPALMIEVAVHARPASNLRINGSRTFMDLCAEGFISTDGTEDQVHFTPADGGLQIGPIMPVGSRPFVFDSFADFLENRPSTPITGPTFRIRVHEVEQPSND